MTTAHLTLPPGPRPLPLLGHVLPFMRDRLGFVSDAASYGPISRVHLLGRPFYLITSPELLKEAFTKHASVIRKDRFFDQLRRLLGDGLVTSEDPLWRRQRKLLAHAFTPSRISVYAEQMVGVATDACDRWASGQDVNMHRAMAELTMDIIGRTLFDIDLRIDAPELERAWNTASNYYVRIMDSPFSLPAWWPSIGNLRFRRASRTIDRVIHAMIKERRASNVDRGDLLSAMLFATDDHGRGMSAKLVRDECMTMFIAGHETSGLALVHTLYLLAKHPEIEAQVYDEVTSVLQGRRPTAEDAKALQLTERVVKESMRIYPPVWGLLRRVEADIELGGHRVPRGSTLMLSQWVTHRWPSVFPDSECFRPDRWLPENAKSISRFAYFPFGIGHRACIANHFSMMELVLVVATLLQRFRFDALPNHTLRFRPSVTLCPEEELIMRVSERNDSARWGDVWKK